MTLREQMEADVPAVFLVTDEHGESVIITDPGFSPRTITAIVNEDGSTFEQPGTQDDVEGIWLFVSRDDDGIANPQQGTALTITRGDETKTYKYAGERADADEFAWWLRFVRAKRERIGHNVGPR